MKGYNYLIEAREKMLIEDSLRPSSKENYYISGRGDEMDEQKKAIKEQLLSLMALPILLNFKTCAGCRQILLYRPFHELMFEAA